MPQLLTSFTASTTVFSPAAAYKRKVVSAHPGWVLYRLSRRFHMSLTRVTWPCLQGLSRAIGTSWRLKICSRCWVHRCEEERPDLINTDLIFFFFLFFFSFISEKTSNVQTLLDFVKNSLKTPPVFECSTDCITQFRQWTVITESRVIEQIRTNQKVRLSLLTLL